MSVNITMEYDKTVDVDYERISEIVMEAVLEKEGCPYECIAELTITGNDEIQTINKDTRNIDSPTDVLSFPTIDYESPSDFTGVDDDITLFDPDSGELLLGDIVINYDRVISQAEEFGHSRTREFAFLFCHSMLHLLGYDHMSEEEEKVMFGKQKEILDELNITRERV